MLSEEEQKFVEQVGLAFEPQGVPRTAGRVLGCLLLAEPPHLSSQELAESLQASKASVSTQTRLLLGTGLIERVGVPGARGDYFRLISRGWGELLRLHIDKMARVRHVTEQNLALADARGKSVRDRMKAMHDFFLFVEQELPTLIARWEDAHAERRGNDSEAPAAGE